MGRQGREVLAGGIVVHWLAGGIQPLATMPVFDRADVVEKDKDNIGKLRRSRYPRAEPLVG